MRGCVHGGGGAVRRREVVARFRVVVIAALVVTLTAGCPRTGSPETEPNEVDEARAQALLDDWWQDVPEVNMTSYQVGTDNLDDPTESGRVRAVRGTPERSVLAEMAADGAELRAG